MTNKQIAQAWHNLYGWLREQIKLNRSAWNHLTLAEHRIRLAEILRKQIVEQAD